MNIGAAGFSAGVSAMIKASKADLYKCALRSLFVLATFTGAGSALAQTSIGSAATIERDVSGIVSGKTRAVSAGDGVFSNETIRTANSSAAQLRFLDQTNLSIGPSAQVILDRFVYNPDQTASEAAVRVMTGAARWVGGTSQSQAYRIRTPTAVIGVRGTTFDLLVDARRTIVTLREGEIFVCPIDRPQRCVTLNQPGQTVVVTRSTAQGPTPGNQSETQFASNCLSAVDRSACDLAPTRQATIPPDEQVQPVRTARTVVRRPVAPPRAETVEPTWTSTYVGGHLGGSHTYTPVSVSGSTAVTDSIALGNVPTDLTPSGTSVMGGVQFGRTWQINNVVVGFEADFSGMAASGEDTVVRSPLGIVVTTSASEKVDAFSTLRARAGIAAGNWLVYATAGAAFGHVNMSGSIAGACVGCAAYSGQQTLWQAGYAAGGGTEIAISARYALRFEFLYYDLGSRSLFMNETTGFAPGEYATMRFQTHGAIVRTGFNVRF
jgi:opacity protein-like surface antigen